MTPQPTSNMAVQRDLTAELSGAVSTVLKAGDQLIVPVIREEVRIEVVRDETGVLRVRKEFEERIEHLDLPAWSERADVQRIAIGRPAERVEQPRQEGDEWVVPVYEERLVVQRQLFLREELRVKTVRESHQKTEAVKLASERVAIERRDPASNEWRNADGEFSGKPGAAP